MSENNSPTAELDEAKKDSKTAREEYFDKLKNFITTLFHFATGMASYLARH